MLIFLNQNFVVGWSLIYVDWIPLQPDRIKELFTRLTRSQDSGVKKIWTGSIQKRKSRQPDCRRRKLSKPWNAYACQKNDQLEVDITFFDC
jgi:hypothetical protein